MTDINLEYLCHNAMDIARVAGHKINQIYTTDFDIQHKADKTPLTTADMAAHRIIVDSLQQLTPEIPVLSEESDSIQYEVRQLWQRYWLVDPLDGTREFIKRNGEFSVNIALIDQQQSILGVIYAPVLDEMYYAWQGGQAYKISPGHSAAEIHCKTPVGQSITVAGSRSHASEKLQNYLKNLGEYELISLGSSLKSCLVAEGKADIYPRLGLTSEWDTAAAQCIVEQAGGQMTDFNMKPLRYNTKDSLLNPEFLVFGDTDIDWSKFV